MRAALESKLRNMDVRPCTNISRTLPDPASPALVSCANMWQLYCQYWRPFGELLVDLEYAGAPSFGAARVCPSVRPAVRPVSGWLSPPCPLTAGMHVDRRHLADAEARAP